MSKNELLDSLRFGADKIFRSKDSSVTEADIDAILEEGRKRTEAMNKAANDKLMPLIRRNNAKTMPNAYLHTLQKQWQRMPKSYVLGCPCQGYI